MSAFGRVLNNFAQDKIHKGLHFIVRDRSSPQNTQRILMSSNVISDLIYKSQWRMGRFEIKMSSLVALTEIVLVLKDNEEFPISGFPRRLQEDDKISGEPSPPPPRSWALSKLFRLVPKIQDTYDDANRWRDRSENQETGRKKWIQATAAKRPPGLRRMRSLSGYSSSEYIIVGRPLPVGGVPELSNTPASPKVNIVGPMSIQSPVEMSASEDLVYLVELEDTSGLTRDQATSPSSRNSDASENRPQPVYNSAEWSFGIQKRKD